MRSIAAFFSLMAVTWLALGLSLGFWPEKLPFWPVRAPVYDLAQGDIGGEPGSIIRVWPLEGGGPGGGDAFRILYRSTGLNGEPIAVSGAIFIPPGSAPERGRDVIAWAHPTSGVVEACAPSLMPDVAGMIWGLEDMLAQGHVVVATDYPGLGVPGQIHPYLIGVSEGRSVLDSVRAARDAAKLGRLQSFRGVGPQPRRPCRPLCRRACRKLCARLEALGRGDGGASHLSDRAVRDRQIDTDREGDDRDGRLLVVEAL